MTPLSRTRLRLRLRDLAAGAAFGSIAASGSVPAWTMGAFGLALVLALLDLRVFAGRAPLAGLGLVASAALLFGSALSGELDLVVAACSFAALITAQRMLADATIVTDNQVHLTSLLMLAGGAALSGELLYGACLATFAMLASLSLCLGVLEGAAPDALTPVLVRPLLSRVAWGCAAALMGGMIFFILFPRLSWNVAARRVSPGLGSAAAGFGDRVRLGGSGSIKTNPRLVLRATVSPDPGREHLERYWVGRYYDTFDGKEWRSHAKPKRPVAKVQLRPSASQLVHQQVELLPAYGSRTLVALDPPVMVGNAIAHATTGNNRTNLLESPGEEVQFADPAVGYSYHAYSLPSGADRAQEASEVPFDPTPLLQLPQGLDPRVRALAHSIVGSERAPLVAARALEQFLQTRFQYTLDLPGEVEDPLADFLFVKKEGHCEHFATALTMLLRAEGIPARVVAGFFGGERVADQYVVRAGDAHAWTEVYLPEQGFVPFDATPADRRPGQPSPLLNGLVRFYEELEGFWRSKVVDYSIQDQADLASALIRPPHARGTFLPSLPPAPAFWVATGAGLLAFFLFRLLALRRAPPRVHEATRLANAIDRVLFEIPREDGEDLEQLAARLTRTRHPAALPVGEVTHRYLEARFGPRPLRPGERTALVRKLERALRPPLRG